MIRNIVRDVEFLSIPSTDLKSEELYVVQDLIDTLKFHIDKCVGMAGNMIGYSKNVIVIRLNTGRLMPLINPVIIDKKDVYSTEEGCLSLDGQRTTLRFKKIKVKYLDEKFKIKIKVFQDFEAQIVQHEIDHLFGKII